MQLVKDVIQMDGTGVKGLVKATGLPSEREGLIFPDDYVLNNKNIISEINGAVKKGHPFHYIFRGPVGCGKTYLANIVAECSLLQYEFIQARKAYRRYLELLNSEYTDKMAAIRRHERRVLAPCVIFDDVGNEPETDSSASFIGNLIEERYDLVKKGFPTRTIITTNLTQAQLRSRYGDRVIDRLVEICTIMEFDPRSFRADQEKIIRG